jgi:hypothetical protein
MSPEAAFREPGILPGAVHEAIEHGGGDTKWPVEGLREALIPGISSGVRGTHERTGFVMTALALLL